jgi:hypothetical protein
MNISYRSCIKWRSVHREAKRIVDRDPVETSFENGRNRGISHVSQQRSDNNNLDLESTLMHMISMHTLLI